MFYVRSTLLRCVAAHGRLASIWMPNWPCPPRAMSYKESCMRAFGVWLKSLAIGAFVLNFTALSMAQIGFVIDVGGYQGESGDFAKPVTT